MSRLFDIACTEPLFSRRAWVMDSVLLALLLLGLVHALHLS